MLQPTTRDWCTCPALHWKYTLATHARCISADIYNSIVEFMLNMHILIALCEIISQCIFLSLSLSLSSVQELSKQQRGPRPHPPTHPPAVATSTRSGPRPPIIISSAVQLQKVRARGVISFLSALKNHQDGWEIRMGAEEER